MPGGLQLKDRNGKIILDIGDRPLVLQRSVITTANQAGFFDLIPGDGGIWYQVSQVDRSGYDRPNVTRSGNRISWDARSSRIKITGGAW